MVGFDDVLYAAELLYQKAATVEANRAQSKRLAKRVRLLVENVRQVNQLRNSEEYAPARDALKSLIEQAVALITKFQNEPRRGRFFYAGTWKGKFSDLHQSLADCIQSFGLSLNAQSLAEQAADQADVLEDIASLHAQIEDVLGQGRHTRDELVTTTKAIKALESESVQNQQALDQLAKQLEGVAQSGSATEVVVVESGARIGRLTHKFIDTNVEVSIPEGTNAATVLETAQMAKDVFGDAPRRPISVTVVQKNAHIQEVIDDSISFQGRLSLTERGGGFVGASNNILRVPPVARHIATVGNHKHPTAAVAGEPSFLPVTDKNLPSRADLLTEPQLLAEEVSVPTTPSSRVELSHAMIEAVQAVINPPKRYRFTLERENLSALRITYRGSGDTHTTDINRTLNCLHETLTNHLPSPTFDVSDEAADDNSLVITATDHRQLNALAKALCCETGAMRTSATRRPAYARFFQGGDSERKETRLDEAPGITCPLQ